MKKIVSMLLTLMLIFSMSTALAQQWYHVTGDCSVKMVCSPSVFVEWSHPSDITLKKDNASVSLAESYAVEVTDALIGEGQELRITFLTDKGTSDTNSTVTFDEGPVSSVKLCYEGRDKVVGKVGDSVNQDDSIDKVMASGKWTIPLKVGEVTLNNNWVLKSQGTHVIGGVPAKEEEDEDEEQKVPFEYKASNNIVFEVSVLSFD